VSTTETSRHETIMPMDKHVSDDDHTWSRFWLGAAIVIAFAIASIVLVITIGGTRAGADYGLSALMVTLLVALIDGIVLARRRRNR
jgi:hypothetical protein